MPTGDRSFALTVGPQLVANIRMHKDTMAVLRLAAGEANMTRTALTAQVVEDWADMWLRQNAAEEKP